jgi:hypothetical protein
MTLSWQYWRLKSTVILQPCSFILINSNTPVHM